MGSKRSNNTSRFINRREGFTPRYRDVVKSPAYLDLKPVARCLLDELQSNCYSDARNNGWLSLSTANAAKLLKSDEKTVMRAFKDLESHGFIVLIKGQMWQQRKAREWRITYLPYKDQKPTDEWKSWKNTN